MAIHGMLNHSRPRPPARDPAMLRWGRPQPQMRGYMEMAAALRGTPCAHDIYMSHGSYIPKIPRPRSPLKWSRSLLLAGRPATRAARGAAAVPSFTFASSRRPTEPHPRLQTCSRQWSCCRPPSLAQRREESTKNTNNTTCIDPVNPWNAEKAPKRTPKGAAVAGSGPQPRNDPENTPTRASHGLVRPSKQQDRAETNQRTLA